MTAPLRDLTLGVGQRERDKRAVAHLGGCPRPRLHLHELDCDNAGRTNGAAHINMFLRLALCAIASTARRATWPAMKKDAAVTRPPKSRADRGRLKAERFEP